MSPAEIIVERSIPVTESGCWIWMHGVNSRGYGYVRIGGKQHGAHRLSYEVARGPIPGGMCVMHQCDVPSCVNPDHLKVGSPKDNLLDMRRKLRGFVPTTLRGEENAHSKLAANQVREIRRLREEGKTTLELAKLFNITTTHVSLICLRKIWRHLED